MSYGKASVIVAFVVVFAAFFLMPAAAHSDISEIEEGKQLVESGVSCDNLNDEQLEAMGEYMMELMHPGEQHELMHERMGIQEDTAYHGRFHVNLAQSMYCGDKPMGGMMNMMSGMGGGMAGSGGMMARYGYSSSASYWILTGILYVVLLLGLIGLVYFWLFRLWKGKGRKAR